MLFLNEIPEPPLDKYISGIVYYEGYQTDFNMERFLPDGTTNLVIDLKNFPKFIFNNETLEKQQRCEKTWFSGMHTRYITISSGDDSEMMVITFKAGYCFPFVKRPLIEFVNEVVPASEVFGNAILELRDKLIDESEPGGKLKLAQEWLASVRNEDTFSEKVIQQLVNEIVASPDLVGLQEVAIRSGYSQKQFIHLFKKFVGLTPKQYHRIVRFNEILRAIYGETDIDWVRIAVACGYYDQAHFIRDFQQFSGLNPEKYKIDQGDWAHYIPLR